MDVNGAADFYVCCISPHNMGQKLAVVLQVRNPLQCQDFMFFYCSNVNLEDLFSPDAVFSSTRTVSMKLSFIFRT